MLNKEIFGNGFLRVVAAPDMANEQRLYFFAGDGRCIAQLTPGEVRALELGARLVVADMDGDTRAEDAIAAAVEAAPDALVSGADRRRAIEELATALAHQMIATPGVRELADALYEAIALARGN